MKILYVTNMYPSDSSIHSGIFIKEQIESYVKQYQTEFEICLIDGIKTKLNYLKSIFTVNLKISRQHYDLIHIHFGLTGIFLLFNPFIKTPVVLTLHGSDIQSFKKRDGLMQYVSRMVIRKCDKVIILNDRMAASLDYYKNKLVKIPCGINASSFNTIRNNAANEKFRIGFPAQKEREVKNYALFEVIVKALQAQGNQIEIIEFRDFTRAEVVHNLSKLDCLLMTSLSEGSPQIIKEALACNVPIVTTKVGDVAWLLDGVYNCTIVDSFEPQPFVDAIKCIINLPPSERKNDGSARIKLLKLDQDSVVDRLHYLYSSLVPQKHPA